MLLIDELYQDETGSGGLLFEENLLFYVRLVKICWIAVIDLGEAASPRSFISLLRNFHLEPLNVLFRSAHHISEHAHYAVHSLKPLSETSAKVIGCYSSSQPQFIVNSFSSIDDENVLNEEFQRNEFKRKRWIIGK